MTSSSGGSSGATLAEPTGAQKPRICWVPPYVSSFGEEALELAELAGLVLDPWQAFVLAHSLDERADGKWAAFEVGVMVARQNGKGGILEARELAGLFILGERLLIHSAHQFDTSLEAFRRLLQLIEDTPDLDQRVQRVSRSHGEEGIELKKNPRTGLRQRIRFRTRTKGGGRGFSGDLLVLDEPMFLPESAHGALLPTLSARPNPQVWYTGSPVDQHEHDDGVVFARVRERGHNGGDPSLLYCEWSPDVAAWLAAHGLMFDRDRGELEQITPELAADPEVHAAANPGLGIRIRGEHIEKERRSMSSRKFAVERLGIGDWPDTSEQAERLISAEAWARCAEHDRENEISRGWTFAVDTNTDQTWAAIGVAGARNDKLRQLAVVKHERGTDWVLDDCKELHRIYPRAPFVMDPGGPAANLIPSLKEAGIKVIETTARDYGDACADLVADATAARPRIRYPSPQPELDEALAAARAAPLGDRWKWSRKNSTSADISPLVAVTLARWGHARKRRRPRVINPNAL